MCFNTLQTKWANSTRIRGQGVNWPFEVKSCSLCFVPSPNNQKNCQLFTSRVKRWLLFSAVHITLKTEKDALFKTTEIAWDFGVTQKRICRLLKRYCNNIDIKLIFSSFKIGNLFSAKDPIPKQSPFECCLRIFMCRL